MSCRTATSTLLTAALLICLLALDHPVAHARHLKDQSIPTGDSSSVKKGLQHGVNRKLDGGKTQKFENVGVKTPNAEGAQEAFGSSSRNGGTLGVESNKASRHGGGPEQHPKKHN